MPIRGSSFCSQRFPNHSPQKSHIYTTCFISYPLSLNLFIKNNHQNLIIMKEELYGFTLFDLIAFENWLSEQKTERQIIRVQNHHTWRPNYTNFKGNNQLELLKNMKQYHVNHNGWSDIAQNLTTFQNGTIAICRSLEKTPVGIKGANTGAICIEHMGNFDGDGDTMTEKHKNTIIHVNAALCHKFCLIPNKDSIVYHHWYDLHSGVRTNGKGTTKSCPGTNFFGGNRVEDAEQNFYPLIMDKFMALEGELDFISYGKVTASQLNLRDGPGLDHTVVGSIHRETTVRIYEKSGEWYKVDRSGMWAFSKYIVPIEKPDRPE